MRAQFLDIFQAWRHWKDGTSLELMDPTLRDSYVINEVTRCTQIGLFCIQEKPIPTMARVVLKLSSTSVTLPHLNRLHSSLAVSQE
ncbi:hypothetical protein SLEP1_g29557 [Rubroshorea leprosula]|uniref:Uncharacterized protein n=1 Tax=Rubroshorea leprosula TaxID=152421 RepID=A0AAV5JZS7_9ROSI|nr:hypothetical protein SLEP1_g29557 [Rubroshorea leprosula]